MAPEAPISKAVKQQDVRNKLAKERYKQRDLIEEEYKIRNAYESLKKEELAKNRVHNGRLL